MDTPLPHHVKARLSVRLRVGIWANIVSAVMLIGVAGFWVARPAEASAGAFSIEPDSAAALDYAQIAAIFKAVGDVLPPIFSLLALRARQWHLVGLFNLVTLVLIPGVDMAVWGIFSGLDHVLMHAPFALPLVVGAYCLLGYKEQP